MDEAGGVYPSNEYGRYCVPEGLEDRPAARAVIAGRAYEPDTLRFMRQHAGCILPPPLLVLQGG